jgi:hypothetical protein
MKKSTSGKPDYQFWGRNQAFWTVQQAAFLFMGFDPDSTNNISQIYTLKNTIIGWLQAKGGKFVTELTKAKPEEFIELADQYNFPVLISLREVVNTRPKPSPENDVVQVIQTDYTTPYLELMKQAIVENKITNGNQVKVVSLKAWFIDKGVSERLAGAMATIVRHPESKQGAAKPRKNG